MEKPQAPPPDSISDSAARAARTYVECHMKLWGVSRAVITDTEPLQIMAWRSIPWTPKTKRLPNGRPEKFPHRRLSSLRTHMLKGLPFFIHQTFVLASYSTAEGCYPLHPDFCNGTLGGYP